MNMFYCAVVGGGIDTLACDTRIQQAETMKEKGEEHVSLFKCLKCTNQNRKIMVAKLAGEKSKATVFDNDKGKKGPKPIDKTDDPICLFCNRPKSALKQQFIFKDMMHVNCGTKARNLKKKEEVKTKVTKPITTEKVAEKKVPTLQTEEETIDITIDFTGHEDLRKEIIATAKAELRTPEMQALYYLKSFLR